MTAALTDLGNRLATYLSGVWEEPVVLSDIEQIPGGASRETYRVQLTRGTEGATQGVILRRDPATSLIDTERALEFRTYEAAHRCGIPVPEPLLLEEDPSVLDRPFSLMAEITGCETATANFALSPFAEVRDKLSERKWSLLGRLATMDLEELGVHEFMPIPQHPAAHELEYWSGVIRADALQPQPVAEAAIRWLENRLPEPSGQLCLVHGDYRSGNFLYNAAGEIPAILDWEMAHIGDPLEDLAWSFDPLWAWPDKVLAGGLLERKAAMAIWQRASNLQVDADTFRWWQVFASLKGLAIWISSTEDFAHGASREPILAVAGWLMTDRHNRILVDRLNPASSHQYSEPLQ